MRPVAESSKGKMIFVHIDSDIDANFQVLEYFGFAKEDCPKFVIYEVIYPNLEMIN